MNTNRVTPRSLRYLVSILAFALVCAHAQSSTMPQTIQNDIRSMVMSFYSASSNADLDTIEGMISAHPNAIFIGTDPDEVFIGHEAIVAWWGGIFEALAGLGYDGLPLSSGGTMTMGMNGNTVWVFDEAAFNFNNGDVPTRLTLVMQREGGRWKIVQGHFSIGVADTDLPL